METRWYRTWAAAGAMTAVVVAIVRFWVARGRDEFSLWPDEPAQLAMSRFLGGGVPWTMHDHSTWQPGYATLLSPVHWFTDDPVTVFHTALALNAILGGVAAYLLVMLARRLTTLRPLAGAVSAGIVALSPAALFTTEFTWSESLVAVLFLATVLALLRFGETPTTWRGVTAGAVAALAFGTHSRMLPLAAVTVGLVGLSVARRRMEVRSAAIVVVATVVAMIAVRLYAGFVFDQLWDEPSTTNSMGGVIDHIGAPGTILIALAGQAWYVLVSTVGLAVYGTLFLVGSVRRSAPDPDPDPDVAVEPDDRADCRADRPARLDSFVVLVIVMACIVPSVLFMAGRMRPDQIIYGRYNDGVLAPVLIAGLGFLLTASGLRRLVIGIVASVALTIGCAAVLLAWRRDTLESDAGLEPMILGLQPYMGGVDSIDVVRITVTAVVVTVLVGCVAALALRAGRPALTLVAVGGLVLVGSWRTSTIIDDGWHGRGDLSRVATLADGALANGVDVSFLLPDGESTDRLTLYQMYLPANRFTVVEELADVPAGTLVFAPRDEAALVDSATVEWQDPDRDWALWRQR